MAFDGLFATSRALVASAIARIVWSTTARTTSGSGMPPRALLSTVRTRTLTRHRTFEPSLVGTSMRGCWDLGSGISMSRGVMAEATTDSTSRPASCIVMARDHDRSTLASRALTSARASASGLPPAKCWVSSCERETSIPASASVRRACAMGTGSTFRNFIPSTCPSVMAGSCRFARSHGASSDQSSAITTAPAKMYVAVAMMGDEANCDGRIGMEISRIAAAQMTRMLCAMLDGHRPAASSMAIAPRASAVSNEPMS